MVKWTVIIGLWRKYKLHLFASFILLVSFLLITLLHQDFVEYNQQSETNYLGLSYGIKWLAYFISIAVYLVFIKNINKAAYCDSTLHEMMKHKETQAEYKTDTIQSQSEQASDPFAHLRTKKTLRSKADFIIDENQDK